MDWARARTANKLEPVRTFIIEHRQRGSLGNGYCFVARQKRILIEDDEYFADLVFYNRLLRCFVVVELKSHKINHKDLGQLQMSVYLAIGFALLMHLECFNIIHHSQKTRVQTCTFAVC